jgi:hypothetical protein
MEIILDLSNWKDFIVDGEAFVSLKGEDFFYEGFVFL